MLGSRNELLVQIDHLHTFGQVEANDFLFLVMIVRVNEDLIKLTGQCRKFMGNVLLAPLIGKLLRQYNQGLHKNARK